MDTDYQPDAIEPLAQAYWDENDSFSTKEDLAREKFYCLSMLPYPSGDLHVGHVRNYTIGDAISRYQRAKGKNVLQPMGWDAFGLPAENAAIAKKLPPAEWTRKNIKRMKGQLKQLGFGLNWDREIATCDPSYYRWEQWLFIQLYKKGMIYKKESTVNWDPIDQTVLANEQVVDGKGWRSGATIERKKIPQWFFKITAYAQELLDDIDTLDEWPEQVKTMQRNWIGRSTGLEIDFAVTKQKRPLTVFTTRQDTLMGVSFLAIATDHPLAILAAEHNTDVATFNKKVAKLKVAESEFATLEKEGVDSGITAIHPITKKKVPIWVTNFVLMNYGTGAVMGVPAHDARDHTFAIQYKLPILPVLKGDCDYSQSAFIEKAPLINSDNYTGLTSKKAFKQITADLIEMSAGREVVNYRLRDW